MKTKITDLLGVGQYDIICSVKMSPNKKKYRKINKFLKKLKSYEKK